jgi:hypothetical protein
MSAWARTRVLARGERLPWGVVVAATAFVLLSVACSAYRAAFDQPRSSTGH